MIYRNQYDLDIEFNNDYKYLLKSSTTNQLMNEFNLLFNQNRNQNNVNLAKLNYKDKPKNFKLYHFKDIVNKNLIHESNKIPKQILLNEYKQI